MWWMVAAAVASSVYQGVAESNRSKAQARLESQYASYNAQNVYDTGVSNAAALEMAGRFNAGLTMAGAKIASDTELAIAEYNSNMQRVVSEFNASLLEDEAKEIWEQADLDTFQMEQEFARTKGHMEAAYGASGVLLGGEGDSPELALIDAQTQYELDVAVVRHGADKEAGKVLDSAAVSRWQGAVAAQQIMYEANASARAGLASAGISALGAIGQSKLDARMTLYNAGQDASRIMFGGESKAHSLRSGANAAMSSAMFSGAMNGLSTYYGSKTPAVKRTSTVRNTAPAATHAINYRPMSTRSSSNPYTRRSLIA